jgi:excisionase family DNA binding protein
MAVYSTDPLTVAETARILRRSTEQVRRYLREGVLAGRRVGGQWFIDRDEVERLLQRRATPEFLLRLAAADPDPLSDVIAIGGSGGGDIASGRASYVRAFAGGDES